MDIFSAPHFRDDLAARMELERILWPNGPVCPHCGVVNHAYATKRPGLYRCAEKECRKDFTVTMRTIMERSKIPLHKWLQAFHLMTSSKKGISTHQLHRTLDIGYEAAWFLSMRIREAMREGGLASPKVLGGDGRIVEADETYLWKTDKPVPRSRGRVPKPTKKGKSGPADKRAIVALVERHGRVAFCVGRKELDGGRGLQPRLRQTIQATPGRAPTFSTNGSLRAMVDSPPTFSSVSEPGVVIVGYVSLGAPGDQMQSESGPSFSIEEEVPLSAECDESITIHVHSMRGAPFATHIVFALFRALTPEVISWRETVSVSHPEACSIIPFPLKPRNAD